MVLSLLNISAENWLTLTTQFTNSFHGAVGMPMYWMIFVSIKHDTG